MPGAMHSPMGELKLQWLQAREDDGLETPREKQDDPPMPAPTWKPEVREPPIEPESDDPEEIVPPVPEREIGEPQ